MRNIPFRSPDKPSRIFSLNAVSEGDFIAQKKIDGHNAVIIVNDGIEVRSRHNKPLPVSKKILGQIEQLGLSDGDVVVGEWTSRRNANKEETLPLFSILYREYEWLGGWGEEDRYNLLREKIAPTEDIQVLESQDRNYADLFRSTIDDWVTEGIVLKHKEAKLTGNRSGSVKNRLMLKLKWRDGADGAKIMVVPDEKLIPLSS